MLYWVNTVSHCVIHDEFDISVFYLDFEVTYFVIVVSYSLSMFPTDYIIPGSYYDIMEYYFHWNMHYCAIEVSYYNTPLLPHCSMLLWHNDATLCHSALCCHHSALLWHYRLLFGQSSGLCHHKAWLYHHSVLLIHYSAQLNLPIVLSSYPFVT